jgi:hypothetical protein
MRFNSGVCREELRFDGSRHKRRHKPIVDRVSPLVLAVVASATIAGLVALGSMTGLLPNKRSPVQGDEPMPRAESKHVQPSACAVCGTIESIRTVEVLEEGGATGGVAEVKSDKDGGAASPNATMSVLDTLSRR